MRSREGFVVSDHAAAATAGEVGRVRWDGFVRCCSGVYGYEASLCA